MLAPDYESKPQIDGCPPPGHSILFYMHARSSQCLVEREHAYNEYGSVLDLKINLK